MNSRFCFLSVKMNHFEEQLIASSREDSKVPRMTIYVRYFYEKKDKMANAMLEILGGFSSERIQMYRYSKFPFLQVTLNFELK